MKNKVLCLGVLSVCLWLQGCKTPQATTTTSSAALQLPGTYHTDQDSVAVTRSQASAITPWRRFFTDATLEALIDTALVRNQDLKITLQQIAVAKSGVHECLRELNRYITRDRCRKNVDEETDVEIEEQTAAKPWSPLDN